jgi:CHAT domain-containing protein
MLSPLPLAGLVCTIALFPPLTSMAVRAEGAIAQTVKAQESLLQKRLAEGKKQYRSLAFREAIATFSSVIEQAKQQGDRGTQAQALAALGTLYQDIEKKEGLETLLLESLKLARSLPDATVKLDVLGSVLGVYLGQSNLEKVDGLLKEMEAIDLGLVDDRTKVEFQFLQSGVRFAKQLQQKQFPLALLEAQSAIKLAEQNGNQELLAVAIALEYAAYKVAQNESQAERSFRRQQDLSRLIGDRLSEYQQLKLAGDLTNEKQVDQKIAYYQKALAIAKTANNSWFQLLLLGNIGNIYDAQSKVAYGKDYLQGVKLSEQSMGAFQPGLEIARQSANRYWEMLMLLRIAMLHQTQGTRAFIAGQQADKILMLQTQSLQISQQALAIDEDLKDPRLTKAIFKNIFLSHDSRAGVYLSLEQYDNALQQVPLMIAAAEKVGNPQLQKAAESRKLGVYLALSNSYNKPEQYDKRLEINEKIDKLEKQQNDPDLLIYRLSTAQIYAFRGQYDRALAVYEEVLANAQLLHNTDYEILASISIGTIYTNQGNYSKALSIYEKNLPLSRTLRGDRIRESLILNNMAILYAKQGEYAKALNMAQQSVTIRQAAYEQYSKGMTPENIRRFCAEHDPSDRTSTKSSNSIFPDVCNNPEKPIPGFIFNSTKTLIARHATDARIALGRDFNNIGVIAKDQGDYLKASEFSQKSLAIAREFKELNDEATSLNNIGVAFGDLGDNQKANKFLQQALEIAIAQGDRPLEASQHTSLGAIARSQGDYPKALKEYQQALVLSQAMKMRSTEANIVAQIGQLYQAQGNYSKASENYQRALKIQQELGEPAKLITTLSYIGGLQSQIGQVDQALATDQSALAIAQKIGARQQEAYVLLSIADDRQQRGQTDEALKGYTQALEIARSITDLHMEHQALTNLGKLYAEQNQPDKALITLRQALAIQQRTGVRPQEAKTLTSIGQVQTQLGQYAEAQATLQQAYVLAQAVGNPSTEAKALAGLASLFVKQNQAELAIVFYKQSVKNYELIRQNLRTLPKEQQQSYTDTVEKTYRDLADLLLKNDRILEARQVIELLKLQELDDYSRDTRGQASPLSILKAETALLNAFKQQVTAKYTSLFQATQELAALQAKPDAEKTPAIQKRIRDLETLETRGSAIATEFLSDPTIKAHIQTLQNNDKTLIPTDDNLNQLAETLASLKQSGQSAAILYPLILDDRLEILLITPNGPPLRRTVKIDRKTINATINQFGLDISDLDHNPKATAQQLYQWLVKPIEADLKEAGINTLIYSPDRRLRSVPLAALHDGQQWLIEKYQISHITATSATNLTTKRNALPKVLSGTISDQSTTTYNVKLQSNPKPYEFNGLPSGKVELNAISQAISGSKSLIETDFSSDRLRDNAGQYNILHLATHGYFELGQPENSFLLFSQPDSQGKNYATITDIRNWKLRGIDLVTLSACQTAVAPEQLDTKLGILGISHEFERAGAKSTIASLWRVNDRSTALLMQAFYQNLSQGKTKAEALKNAQTTLLHLNTDDTATQAHTQLNRSLSIKPTTPLPITTKENTGYSHPYYWAPFILIGNSL